MVELSPRARSLLEGRHFGVLATINEDGTPHLTTMWYLLEELNGTDIILMNTRQGRVKEWNMRRNAHVSLCVEDEYSYVTITGNVELIDNPDMTQHDIYRLACRYEGQESALQQMQSTFSHEQRVSIRLQWTTVHERFPK